MTRLSGRLLMHLTQITFWMLSGSL
ncbi:unnamed protein product [Staurois parvus]|uniref:Uncharacterized protein n=1 Tax=Staurois parvus TaxID=386267 RepID=A0ABN9G990_9NEOB|nr:unnamed protein product [Staurois parvus]